MKTFGRLTLLIVSFTLLAHSATAQGLPGKGSPPQRIYGLTIEYLDQLNVDEFQKKFKDVTVPVTLRIVFQGDKSPLPYEKNLRLLHNPPPGKKKFHIVGLPFDSYALKSYKLAANPNENIDCGDFKGPFRSYDHRAKCFVEYYYGARDYIDAWEVGNEVNGEWADEDYVAGLPRETIGKPERTVEKINRLIKYVPDNKPIMLTVSYMPECNEWTANAMDKWIDNFTTHMPPERFNRIDYILVSYYENSCEFHELTVGEVNNNIFAPLRRVFRDQFIGIGEIGYSDGDGEDFETCPRDSRCYCRKGSEAIRKSKISQMQRYYGLKPTDERYIGGGFWWNAGTDYTVKDFHKALKKQFTCLATGRNCETPRPVNCGR
jgi:hypothetical protein